MTDTSTAEPEVQNFRLWLFGAVFFSVPYAFVIMMINGVDFAAAFSLYLSAIEFSAIVIGALAGFAALALPPMKRQWPHLFEAPPKMPDEWMIPPCLAAAVGCVVVGFIWGFSTGAVMLWPLIFVGFTLAHIANWAYHLVKR